MGGTCAVIHFPSQLTSEDPPRAVVVAIRVLDSVSDVAPCQGGGAAMGPGGLGADVLSSLVCFLPFIPLYQLCRVPAEGKCSSRRRQR